MAAAVSTVHKVHTSRELKANIAIERHEALMARHEARLAKLEAKDHAVPSNHPEIPIIVNSVAGDPPTPSNHPEIPIIVNSVAGDPSTSTVAVTPSVAVAATTASSPAPTVTTQVSFGAKLATTATSPSTPSTTSSSSTSTLPANVSTQLQSLYQQYQTYESSGATGTFSPTGLTGLVISGTNVGINVHTNDAADFNALLTQLQSDGLQITASSAAYGLIEGMAPIAQLPAIGQISQAPSVMPMYQPTLK